MGNKLVERYAEIDARLEDIRETSQRADVDAIHERMAELEARQLDLKQTLMRLIALSKIRDEAWLALSHSTTS